MLSAADFAKFIAFSRETVRARHQRHEALGLKGAKRGLPFSEMAGQFRRRWVPGASTDFRPARRRFLNGFIGFSLSINPELEGDTALSAWQRGKVGQVLAAAAGAFSRRVGGACRGDRWSYRE